MRHRPSGVLEYNYPNSIPPNQPLTLQTPTSHFETSLHQTSKQIADAMHFRLFDLPQELQDAIFEFAYPAVDGLKIAFKVHWQIDEDDRRRRDRKSFKPRSFPPLKVDEWMVSRRFFLLASKAWIGALPAQIPMTGRSDSATAQFLSSTCGLYIQHTTRASATIYSLYDLIGDELAEEFFCALGNCTRLQQLELELTEGFFDKHGKVADKHVCEDDFDEDDFKDCILDYELEGLSGIKHLTLSVRQSDYERTTRDEECLQRNVKRLENYLRTRLIGTGRPEPVPSAVHLSHYAPLYYGSEVPALPGQADETDEESSGSSPVHGRKRSFSEYLDGAEDEWSDRSTPVDTPERLPRPAIQSEDIPDDFADFVELADSDMYGIFCWAQSVKQQQRARADLISR